MKAALLLLTVTWALTAPAIAGNTGILRGTAAFESFSPQCCHPNRLAGAAVRITSPQGDLIVKTDSDGRFLFLDVPPGTYSIFVDDKNYYSFCDRVTVTADQAVSADVIVGPRNMLYSENCGRQIFDLVRPGVAADVYDIF
jgi:hypothetical protein